MLGRSTEEVQKALDEVREAARAVLSLPARSAELVNALHLLVMRAGKAVSAPLIVSVSVATFASGASATAVKAMAARGFHRLHWPFTEASKVT